MKKQSSLADVLLSKRMIKSFIATLALLSIAVQAHASLPMSPQHSPVDTMLKRYVAYNQWANTQMADWLSAATDEMMTKEIVSSFPSLQQTVLHIWNAESLWLRVLQEKPTTELPGKGFSGSPKELLDGWLSASAAFLAQLEGMTDEELRGSRPSGERPLAVADIIQHCMNHSTYHRGQLITIGRQAGLVDPPRTDFIYYVRQ